VREAGLLDVQGAATQALYRDVPLGDVLYSLEHFHADRG
jgi:hypothetical protein